MLAEQYIFLCESSKNEKKTCILLHDEVYIKKSLQYHGAEVFGKLLMTRLFLLKQCWDK